MGPNDRIVQVVGEGSDLLIAGTMGRKLTLGGAIEEEEFGRTGAHVASEIGAVMAKMVDLGDKIDWSTAVFDWPGQKDLAIRRVSQAAAWRAIPHRGGSAVCACSP